jgi:hypothetical protein
MTGMGTPSIQSKIPRPIKSPVSFGVYWGVVCWSARPAWPGRRLSGLPTPWAHQWRFRAFFESSFAVCGPLDCGSEAVSGWCESGCV